MRQEGWDRTYTENLGSDLKWYTGTPPNELVKLLQCAVISKEVALDLGCGPGSITAYLCQYFRHVIGLDISERGLDQAREYCKALDVNPTFVCGDACHSPIADESVDFIFDRGCLQGIPLADWPDYFRELERTMRPGGVVQILCRYRKVEPQASLMQDFLANILNRLKQRDNYRSPNRISKCFSQSFEKIKVGEVPFILRTGVKVYFTHAIYKKVNNEFRDTPVRLNR
jgi:ubiquinone/menaquinone biosynthesis C-methylase UbiE